MKYLLFALALFCMTAQARTEYDEFLGGGLTYHIFDSNSVSKRYSYKLNSTGQLIGNPMVSYRQVTVDDDSYSTETVFTGANSIAEPILGMAWSKGYVLGSWRAGLLAGFYFQNNSLLLDKGIMPVFIIPHPGIGPTPVVGGEVTKTIHFGKKEYFLFNLLVTPLILNATVGVGWKY